MSETLNIIFKIFKMSETDFQLEMPHRTSHVTRTLCHVLQLNLPSVCHRHRRRCRRRELTTHIPRKNRFHFPNNIS